MAVGSIITIVVVVIRERESVRAGAQGERARRKNCVCRKTQILLTRYSRVYTVVYIYTPDTLPLPLPTYARTPESKIIYIIIIIISFRQVTTGIISSSSVVRSPRGLI